MIASVHSYLEICSMHMNCNAMFNCKSLSLRMCSRQLTLRLLTYATLSDTSVVDEFRTHATAAHSSGIVLR